MADIGWLAGEAREIHAFFESIFYAVTLTLLLTGVLVEYFKFPLGGTPSFGTLVGRVLVAAILLNAYPEISNLIADISDAISKHLGDFNQVKMVLSKMGDKLKTLTWSWVSLKDTVILLLSFISFFILYFSVFIAEAFITYAWTLLYVFSPILIACFALPVTAGATKALFRSLIEISMWKIVWSVLATLLWSSALSQINNPQYQINFVSAVAFNLILAASLLLTPHVVHALAGAGVTGLANTLGGVAVGSLAISPRTIAKAATQKAGDVADGIGTMRERISERHPKYENHKHLNRIYKKAEKQKKEPKK
ncbi:MAG: hypothetical protein KA715_00230 [Xanthomonadaceae bacterium]|nr:hypothetical protein [Xanthomonadaceae bacterium]